MATQTLYCTNHPQTETLLRCNRCDKPYCVRCLVRTPVGMTCRTCLNIQQVGFYSATTADYAIAATLGIGTSIVSGALATVLAGFWLLEIFYAPFAGGLIAQIIQGALQKRRGRFVWLAGCLGVFFGSTLGASIFPLFAIIVSARGASLGALLLRLPGSFLSLGFLIYIVLAIMTVYARLRS
ncbi:MAG: hypothetical protein HY327_09780 [Chloroflexi bacterium]|nr:hypothetical protein [Chloroflexota bacterium]